MLSHKFSLLFLLVCVLALSAAAAPNPALKQYQMKRGDATKSSAKRAPAPSAFRRAPVPSGI
ncbi:hypothetical protein FA95DRAFT_1606402 [Auriscalpium vulgare]|uniref:Uncharacterized protein n=1 Tax=Auriscalpium vulgare TaxID=40419 RepID=A0ACB8RS92_9AGAM|nr:hypothetical protein FA95DRAFT_1606402 [Auriscalpium vulgare]